MVCHWHTKVVYRHVNWPTQRITKTKRSFECSLHLFPQVEITLAWNSVGNTRMGMWGPSPASLFRFHPKSESCSVAALFGGDGDVPYTAAAQTTPAVSCIFSPLLETKLRSKPYHQQWWLQMSFTPVPNQVWLEAVHSPTRCFRKTEKCSKNPQQPPTNWQHLDLHWKEKDQITHLDARGSGCAGKTWIHPSFCCRWNLSK